MSRRALLVALLLLLGACPERAPAVKYRAAPGDLAIVGATLVPMDRPGSVVGQTVLLRGDRILAVAPAAEIDTRAATVIDGRGQWLLPGLVDMHVHLWSKQDLPLFLLNGVTTVRNLFGAPEHVAWRDEIGRGVLTGPTLITAGPILDGDPPTWPGSAVVTTPEAARAEVIAQKRAGYDWLKIYGGLSRAVYDALLDEAKRQHLPVGGHVPREVDLAHVLAGGQRTIEHLEGYLPFSGDEQVGPEIVAATAAAEVWNCPTLVVMDRLGRLDDVAALAQTRGLELISPMVLQAWDPARDFRLEDWTAETYATMRARNQVRRTLVGALARAGARLVLGTDTGNPYVIAGFAVHDELALLVDAGLTPWQALHAATAAAADVQATPGEFGVIAAGARADLLLVAGDPLLDVGALADPAVVVVRGQVHRRAALLAAVAPPAAPADRFASLPALEAEGTARVAARYRVSLGDVVIGGERMALSQLADGTPVIRGQAVYEMPSAMQLQYRATPDALELTGDVPGGTLRVERRGANVVASPGDVTRKAAADAVIAPQTVAEYVWYAERLATLAIGATATIDAVEVIAEGAVRLDPGRFTFTRRADADGRRVYDVRGTHGALALTGSLSVDPDGAPHRIAATVAWGTFVLERDD